MLFISRKRFETEFERRLIEEKKLEQRIDRLEEEHHYEIERIRLEIEVLKQEIDNLKGEVKNG